MASRLVVDLAVAHPELSQACLLLEAPGYRLARHLAIEIADGGSQGCRQLLLDLGHVGDDIDEVCSLLVDLVAAGATAFGREQEKLGNTTSYDIQERAAKRARETIAPDGVSSALAPRPIGWPTKHQKELAKAEGSEQRLEVEQKHRLKQQVRLANEVRLLGLPAALLADQAVNPEAALLTIAGARRASTIRIRLQRWQRIRRWMETTVGCGKPDCVMAYVDYLLEFTGQDAPRTSPGQIAAALSFIESVGAVPEDKAVSKHPLWMAAVKDAEYRLQSGAPPPKRAPMFFLSLIGALESMVVDEDYPKYKRFIAWVRLIKVWAALRSNDTESITPANLKLSKLGLEGTLERTKTTGPGKKHQHMTFFVASGAFVVIRDWLERGYVLLREHFGEQRDYLVPRAAADYEGARKGLASYMDRAAYGRAVLHDLLLEEAPLVPAEALNFWTEHSERNFVVSCAAALRVPKERRDYIGRWQPGNQSDDYVRTSRQIVTEVQRLIAEQIRAKDPALDEGDLADTFVKFVVEQGMSEEAAKQAKDRLLTCFKPAPGTPTSAAEDLPAEDSGDAKPEEEARHDESPPNRFWVSATRRMKFRRLHRAGGCWVKPGNEAEWYGNLSGAQFHARCRLCFPQHRANAKAARDTGMDSGSTSSASSSSTTSSA